jgi:hypothetical protein
LDLDDAGKSLTKDVAGRWGQNPYRVQFRADGQIFFTEIEEEGKQVGLIPLEEQSKGFRWFFSFDLRFMHDSEGTFEGCVLLLDEPGLHLHPGGQDDLLRRLDEYAAKNVLIYSTHLPFLIDLREPKRIRVISEKDSAATVTEDLSASGPDEKLTLQAALGMRANQHFLVAQRNVVVEGAHDFLIITELNNLLERANAPALPEDVCITAAGGAPEAVYVATFMVGQGLQTTALFDSDGEGRTAEKALREKWLLRYKNSSSRSLLLGDAIGLSGDAEIEDLFDEPYYVQKANEAHREKMKEKQVGEVGPQGTGTLSERMQQGFNSAGIKFNKGSVAKLIVRDLARKSTVAELQSLTGDRATRLMRALRDAFH